MVQKNSLIVFGIIAVILIWLIFFNKPRVSSFGMFPPLVPGTPFYDQIHNSQLESFSKNTYSDVVKSLQSVVHGINFNVLQVNNALNKMPIPPDKTMAAALYIGLTDSVNSKDFGFEKVYRNGGDVMNAAKAAGINYRIIVNPFPSTVIKSVDSLKDDANSISTFINTVLKKPLEDIIKSVIAEASAQNSPKIAPYITNLRNLQTLIPFVPSDHKPTGTGANRPCGPSSPCDFMFYLFTNISNRNVDTAIGGAASAIWMSKNGYPDNIAPPMFTITASTAQVPSQSNSGSQSNGSPSQSTNPGSINFRLG